MDAESTSHEPSCTALLAWTSSDEGEVSVLPGAAPSKLGRGLLAGP